MPLEIIFNEPYTQWDWKIAQYVALIGLAGGAYLTAYVADVLSKRRESLEHGQLAKYGYLTGLLVIAISPPIMLSHLATPFRAMALPFTMSNLGSWMAIGSYLIAGFGLGALLMFGWTAFGKERPNRQAVADGGTDIASDGGTAETATGGRTVGGVRGVANRVGLLDLLDRLADITRPSEKVRLGLGAFFGVLAAGVLLYSAMALGSGATNRVPLWNKTFLIPVQILSGLGAGLAAAVGLTALATRSPGRTLQSYALAASGLLVVSLLAVLATVTMLPGQTPAATEAVNNMLTTYAGLFIGVAIVGGMVLPAIFLGGSALAQRSGALPDDVTAASYVFAGALAVAGKIALALVYILAAEFTPLPLPM